RSLHLRREDPSSRGKTPVRREATLLRAALVLPPRATTPIRRATILRRATRVVFVSRPTLLRASPSLFPREKDPLPSRTTPGSAKPILVAAVTSLGKRRTSLGDTKATRDTRGTSLHGAATA